MEEDGSPMLEDEDENEEFQVKQRAMAEKDRGNEHFRNGRLEEAVRCYTKGMQWDTKYERHRIEKKQRIKSTNLISNIFFSHLQKRDPSCESRHGPAQAEEVRGGGARLQFGTGTGPHLCQGAPEERHREVIIHYHYSRLVNCFY